MCLSKVLYLLVQEFNAKLYNFAFIRDDPFPGTTLGLISPVVARGCPVPEYITGY